MSKNIWDFCDILSNVTWARDLGTTSANWCGIVSHNTSRQPADMINLMKDTEQLKFFFQTF